jgi:toxin-antitoxin system antitoxin component|uniref:HepT-like ribonuclease domain-containing protein n=1 Tax=Prevotella sp. TaxID=59823 RepID=UPI0040258AA0
MTEYTLSNRIAGTLLQIKKAIEQLQDWNKDIQNVDDYYSTPDGMKNLAASCMLIEAIGEGVKQIDKLTQSRLLDERPEIPWQDVIGIRNHIAHGYFDIDGDIVLDVIKNNLDELLVAINYFITKFSI